MNVGGEERKKEEGGCKNKHTFALINTFYMICWLWNSETMPEKHIACGSNYLTVFKEL